VFQNQGFSDRPTEGSCFISPHILHRFDWGTELEPGCGNETGTVGAIRSHTGHFQNESDELLDSTFPVGKLQDVFTANKLRPDDESFSSHDFTSFERAGEIFPIKSGYKFALAGALGRKLQFADAPSVKLTLGVQ
jgi:hypothetical protein